MDMWQYLLASPGLLLICGIVFGLMVGSFCNVAIHRIPVMLFREWRQQCDEFMAENPTVDTEPKQLNLFFPRSHCPSCKQSIPGWHNIPVISYLILAGKCAHCKTRIPLRYPLVELFTALLFAACIMTFGASWQTAFAMIFCGILVVLTFIDLDHQLLPDNLNLGLMWLGILINSNGIFTDLHSAVIGAVAGYLSLWTVATGFKLLTKRDGMGHGDFKLLAALGAWLGWHQLPFIILSASLIGAIVGITMIVCKRLASGQPIPFGPYLAGAGIVALFCGDTATTTYLNWILH